MVRQNCRLGFALLLLGLANPSLNAQSARKTVPFSINVTDRSNAVVIFAQIKICPRGGKLPKNPQKTNEYGKFRSNLEPGIYDLFVTSPMFKPWFKQIQLHEESDETVGAVLEATGRTLVRTGHGWDPPPPAAILLNINVTDESGAPIAFAQLAGLDEDRHFSNDPMQVNEKGEMVLKRVPSTYLVAVTSPGYERWERDVEVGVHDEHSLKITLKRILVP